jgi:hypothetical protein
MFDRIARFTLHTQNHSSDRHNKFGCDDESIFARLAPAREALLST